MLWPIWEREGTDNQVLVEGKCEESAADQQKPNQTGSMHKGAGMGRWWTFNSSNQSDTLLHIAILILQNKSALFEEHKPQVLYRVKWTHEEWEPQPLPQCRWGYRSQACYTHRTLKGFLSRGTDLPLRQDADMYRPHRNKTAFHLVIQWKDPPTSRQTSLTHHSHLIVFFTAMHSWKNKGGLQK